MKSEKAKKYLEHQYDSEKGRADKIVVDDYNQYAIYAVELSEKEMKDKAVYAHKFVCPNRVILQGATWCYNNNNALFPCDGDCIYLLKFKKLLNK